MSKNDVLQVYKKLSRYLQLFKCVSEIILFINLNFKNIIRRTIIENIFNFKKLERYVRPCVFFLHSKYS